MYSTDRLPVVWVLCCCLLWGLTACEPRPDHKQDQPVTLFAGKQVCQLKQIGPRPDPEVEVTLTAVGDLLCNSSMMKFTRLQPHTYNFHTAYSYVKPLLSRSDYTIGNLETTLGGPGLSYRGFPRFNAPDDYALALRDAGFDFLFTSNNHSMDSGEEGLLRTLKVLDKLGLDHTGTFTSQEDMDSLRIVNVKGIRIALLSYTGTTNKIPVPAGRRYLVSYIDFRRMKREIEKARAQGAELVITYFHIGDEYSTVPSRWQQTCVQQARRYGADIILSSHPHVLQPIEYFETENATLDTGLVVWSMGNFLSNDFRPYSDAGNILNIHLTKNRVTKKITLSGVDYVPTWIYRGTHQAKQRHLILPAEWGFQPTRIPFLTEGDRLQMRIAFQNTCDIITARGVDLPVCHNFNWEEMPEVSPPVLAGEVEQDTCLESESVGIPVANALSEPKSLATPPESDKKKSRH